MFFAIILIKDSKRSFNMDRFQNNDSTDATFLEEFLDPEEADEGFEKDLEDILDPQDD